MVMPYAVVIAHPLPADAHSLRIRLVQPGWTGAGGCGQNGKDAVFVQMIHDFFQPSEMKLPFCRFINGPGKNAQRDAVYPCFFHHTDILFKDIRPIQPLLRIIIASMKEASRLWE